MKNFRFWIATLDRLAISQPDRIGNKKLYRTFFATTIIASSQFLAAISATANPVPTPQQPSTLLPTRILLNGGFEEPIVTNWVGAPSLSSTKGSAVTNIAGGNIREGYNETAANSAAKPIIWQSTETKTPRANYTYGYAVEVWRGKPSNIKNATTEGVQYAELNGSDNASLFQDLCVLPSETISWSLIHAARQKTTADPTNIMQVSITDPAGWTGKTPPTAQTGAYYSPSLSTSYSQGWQSKSGSWTSTNTSAKLLRFAFGATQGSDGDKTYGNFIDNVQLTLSPLIDFLPPDPTTNVNLGQTTEGNTTNYYYLSLRINGKMASNGRVRILLNGLNAGRSFRLGSPLKGNATATGLSVSATGNMIKLNIPAGTYDPNLPSDYIHIPIDFSDTTAQANDNLTFTLDGVETGDLATKSSACATDRLAIQTQLIDDDFGKRVERPVRIAAQ